MAATISVSKQVHSNGELRSYGTLNLGVYATGGVAVTPSQFKLGKFHTGGLRLNTSGGYTAEYDATTGKIKAAIGVTGVPSVLVTGGQGAGAALQILPDTNAGVLGKTTATNRTIPGATFGLVAAAGSPAEVADTTDLSSITFTFEAAGPF